MGVQLSQGWAERTKEYWGLSLSFRFAMSLKIFLLGSFKTQRQSAEVERFMSTSSTAACLRSEADSSPSARSRVADFQAGLGAEFGPGNGVRKFAGFKTRIKVRLLGKI